MAADKYISELKENTDTKITASNRKTGFIGFQICIRSVLSLYEKLVAKKSLIYLATYKLNQDHVELFFSQIRQMGGFNNNPSSSQFQSAYKKLLIHCELHEDSNGNCIKFENIPILQKNEILKTEDIINTSTLKYRILNEEINEDEPEPEPAIISMTKEAIIAHIAGFIVRKLENLIKCEMCLSVLRETEDPLKKRNQLINVKNRGGDPFR